MELARGASANWESLIGFARKFSVEGLLNQ